MFDMAMMAEFLKVEPGHGLIQSVLLFMIWLSSRSIKKELGDMRIRHGNMETENHDRFLKIDNRFEKVETRINTLEHVNKIN